jgi:hypothetical protein
VQGSVPIRAGLRFGVLLILAGETQLGTFSYQQGSGLILLEYSALNSTQRLNLLHDNKRRFNNLQSQREVNNVFFVKEGIVQLEIFFEVKHFSCTPSPK